jgi:hypothetical protein
LRCLRMKAPSACICESQGSFIGMASLHRAWRP